MIVYNDPLSLTNSTQSQDFTSEKLFKTKTTTFFTFGNRTATAIKFSFDFLNTSAFVNLNCSYVFLPVWWLA